AGSLALTTTGTLNLASLANYYTGTTTIAGGTLRFSNTSGDVTIGAGATATISGTGTLELAGTTSNLSDSTTAPQRVHVVNNSTQLAAGSLDMTAASGQFVGSLDGTGTFSLVSGADLTANHIVQNVLVINNTPFNNGIIT